MVLYFFNGTAFNPQNVATLIDTIAGLFYYKRVAI